jgi:hypothetical protein
MAVTSTNNIGNGRQQQQQQGGGGRELLASECDFDSGPTNIWTLIEERDWNGVKYQAEHFPDEVKTYVFRRNNNKSDNYGSSTATATATAAAAGGSDSSSIRWRILPLHAAVISDAPGDVIQSLLKSYRDGAKSTDDQGMLPIHIAIKKHADPSRINLLLAAYPGCVDVKNGRGQRPYDMSTTSSSPHQRYYLRAMKRGTATFLAVTTNPFDDLMCGIDIRSVVVATTGPLSSLLTSSG